MKTLDNSEPSLGYPAMTFDDKNKWGVITENLLQARNDK